ncbi:uncharacterized protein [Typha latifolia]|uniref:uncharacterized protein isoform X2 n=1 Tax=Typha latifolia TaxID=4733 RepID=UPI003C2EF5BC
MEGKKKPSSSSGDEFFGRKEDSKASSPSRYFSTVFPPASLVMGKDASPSDSNRTMNKQRVEVQNGHARGAAADGKCKGSSTENWTTCSNEGKPFYPIESTDSPYFGSSVHYGARDFYSTSSSNHVTETPRSYKEEDEDESVATRGDWWQGSLYY